MLGTEERKDSFIIQMLNMFRPQRPQKNMCILQASCFCRLRHRQGGRNSTLGVISTLGRNRPNLGQRHGRKDLHLEGESQRRAWALDSRVKSLDLG
jgi:hypothetical protein